MADSKEMVELRAQLASLTSAYEKIRTPSGRSEYSAYEGRPSNGAVGGNYEREIAKVRDAIARQKSVDAKNESDALKLREIIRNGNKKIEGLSEVLTRRGSTDLTRLRTQTKIEVAEAYRKLAKLGFPAK